MIIKRYCKRAKLKIQKVKNGGIIMSILARPMNSLPIIKDGKFNQFMEESEKTRITKEEMNEIRDMMKNVIQRKRRGHS